MSYDHPSPVKSNTLCIEQDGTSDYTNSLSYVDPTHSSSDDISYSSITTPSPVKNSIHSSVKVAVVSPLFSNESLATTYNSRGSYPVKGTSTPVTSNIYPVKGTSATLRPNGRDNSTLNSSFNSQGSPKGKYSPYKLDNTRSSQSSVSISSNGALNDSFDDRYSIVGYNTSPSTTPSGRNNKAGWYEMHDKHVDLAAQMFPTVLLCGDSIIAGLARYSRIWNKYFKHRSTLNCGIGGDQTQHVLWRMENMKLPTTVKYIVIHCGTNNIDRDTPQDIANGVISCGIVLQDFNRKLKIIVTGLLPRDLEVSYRRQKIKETNRHLKRYCKQLVNFVFMKQDSDWVLDNDILNERLYYTDHLHLIESGNEKFAASITCMLNKLENNESIIYTSDEEEGGNAFERKYGERRKDTPKRESFIYDSPFKLIRKTGERKRSLSPTNDADRLSTKRQRVENSAVNNQGYENQYEVKQKPMRIEEPLLNKQPPLSVKPVSLTPSVTPSVAPGVTPSGMDDLSRSEYHGEFAITKQLKNEKLEGTVKSIDITLTDADRLAARKAKFGATNPIGAGSSSLKRLSDSTKAEIRGRPVASRLLAKRKLLSNTGDST